MRDARLASFLFAGSLLFVAPPAARAQLLALERLEGNLELAADVRRQGFADSLGEERRFDRDRFHERLGIRTQGELLRGGLARFSLGASFGLRQDHIEASDSGNESELGTLLQYDARLSLLPGRPLSLELFGNQHRDDGSQAFGTDTDTSSQVAGATLRAGAPWLPTSLTWQRMESRVKSQFGGGSTLREDTRELLELRAQRIDENVQLTLAGRHEDVRDQSHPPVGDYEIDEGSVLLGLHWGARRQASLRTTARYFQRNGNFDFRTASGGSAFAWTVSDTLESRLDANVTHYDSEGEESTSFTGSGLLRHRLFDSLTTSLRGFGDRSQRDDGHRTVYGGDLDLAYRKALPWQMQLQADVGARYRVEDNDFDDDTQQVLGERLTLTNAVDNFLAEEFVRVATVEVFDGLGGPQLVEGIDYEVTQTGSLTSIDPLPGGALVVGDAVAVNYEFRIDPRSKLGTTDFRAGVGIERGGLRIRYQHHRSDQHLIAGARPTVLRETRQDTLRIRVQTRLSALRISGDALARRERSSTTDYDELRFTQSLTWRPRSSLDLDFTLLQGLRTFMNPSRDSETLSARGSVSWRIARGHQLRAFVAVRRLEDTLSPDQRDLEFGLRGGFEFFRLEVVPTFTFTRRERGGSESSDLRGGLILRRRF